MTWDRARVIKCVHAKGDPFTAAVFFSLYVIFIRRPPAPHATPTTRR